MCCAALGGGLVGFEAARLQPTAWAASDVCVALAASDGALRAAVPAPRPRCAQGGGSGEEGRTLGLLAELRPGHACRSFGWLELAQPASYRNRTVERVDPRLLQVPVACRALDKLADLQLLEAGRAPIFQRQARAFAPANAAKWGLVRTPQAVRLTLRRATSAKTPLHVALSDPQLLTYLPALFGAEEALEVCAAVARAKPLPQNLRELVNAFINGV
jgi:hypothetical protein